MKLIVVRREFIDTIGMSLTVGVLLFAKYVFAKRTCTKYLSNKSRLA